MRLIIKEKAFRAFIHQCLCKWVCPMSFMFACASLTWLAGWLLTSYAQYAPQNIVTGCTKCTTSYISKYSVWCIEDTSKTTIKTLFWVFPSAERNRKRMEYLQGWCCCCCCCFCYMLMCECACSLFCFVLFYFIWSYCFWTASDLKCRYCNDWIVVHAMVVMATATATAKAAVVLVMMPMVCKSQTES